MDKLLKIVGTLATGIVGASALLGGVYSILDTYLNSTPALIISLFSVVIGINLTLNTWNHVRVRELEGDGN